jgi:ethanolamine utilization protein EutQ (cupin superfamily)
MNKLRIFSRGYNPRNSHFDTFRFVQRLEQDGFTRDTSEAIMNSMSEVIDESSSQLTASLATRQDVDKSSYIKSVDFAQLKSEITLLEKNEFALLKHDVLRLQGDRFSQRRAG